LPSPLLPNRYSIFLSFYFSPTFWLLLVALKHSSSLH
jgi:hypothetical protein